MKSQNKWSIALLKLPLGQTQEQFEIDQTLFADFEKSPITKGNLVANVLLDKSETMLVADVTITGEVELTCDRTDQLFMEPIKVQDRIVYRFGNQEVEHSENLFEIMAGTPELSFEELFYNLIVVALPMKRLHPSVRGNALEQDAEGNLLVYSTKSELDEAEEESPKADNPFSVLLKLNNLN